MNHENWEEVYRLAMLEVDSRKMPDRISSARESIAGRLQEVNGYSVDREERDRLEHALNALKILTTESQTWR
jgi:hypothetical protein